MAHITLTTAVFLSTSAYRVDAAETSLRTAISQDVEEDCTTVSQVRTYCSISDHPGACYNSTDVGHVQCYSAEQGTAGPPECPRGQDMRCTFPNYGVVLTDAEIGFCSAVPGEQAGRSICEEECSLLLDNWGACYVTAGEAAAALNPDERCRCVPRNDQFTLDAFHVADHCLTLRIGDSYQTYDGVCRFPSDASSFDLQDCLDVPSYPGKCPIENNPGACFSQGTWMCWSRDMWRTNRECHDVHGFDGACMYHDFGQVVAEADIQYCTSPVCDNCDPVVHWGGCYEETLPDNNCLCAPRADESFIGRLKLNSCKTQLVEGTTRAYSGVCRLPTPPDTPEEMPECREIATFVGQCSIRDYQGACYRDDGSEWRCWSPDHSLTPFECRLSRDDVGHTAGFSGSCEFKEYGQRLEEADLPLCTTLDKCASECAPVQYNWGACYPPAVGVPESETLRCLCAPLAATEMVNSDLLLKASCETKRIGELDFTYTGVCKFPKDISELELPECLAQANYADKCAIETFPGACYNAGDRPWSCWTEAVYFLVGECVDLGFTGACKFGNHGVPIAEEDVPECHEIQGLVGKRCAECDQEIHEFACYQEEGDQESECYCGPRADPALREVLLHHSCDTRGVPSAPGTAYKGICKVPRGGAFGPVEPDEVTYRCEDVGTYNAAEGTVNCMMAGTEMNSACFSTEAGVSWQCFEEAARNPHCRRVTTTGLTGHFHGGCVFNGAEAWQDAEIWVAPTEAPSTHDRRRRSQHARGDAHRAASPMALAAALLAAAALTEVVRS